jgi:two-component system phosphate regulon sensor histidine kinase PhoR
MNNRLFYKSLATYLVIMILTVAFFYLLAWSKIRTSFRDSAEEALMSYARIVDLNSMEEIKKQIGRIGGISRARVTLMDAAGKVLADSEKRPEALDNHLNRPEIQEARVKGEGSAIRHSRTIGMDMLYVALPVKQGAAIAGYVRLSRPLFEVKSASDELLRSLIASILIMLVPSFLIALIFSYRLTVPIKKMETFTERLRRGREPGTLLIETGDEMKTLADNINFLVAELRNQIRVATEEKEKLIAAFASMNEGVLLLDGQGKIENCNRAFIAMFEKQYGRVIGKTLIEAFRNVSLQNAFERFKQSGEPLSEEIVIGEISPVILNVNFSRIHGQEEKTIAVFYDLTRLKRLEKMRVDFVANVTHEIKTPLTAILGFVETLQKGAIEEKETALRFLDIIHKHANRLNRLLEDLLTISNIELGEMKFFFESVALKGVVEHVLPLVSARAAEKKIALHRTVPEELPLIRADRDRLVQIILNVLDNAVKFTPEGGEVSIAASAQDGWVELRISDTGFGVPQNEIARMGERFYRVDKARSRELGGTGLGLSIVKHLMSAHGGRMEIQSRLGEGTKVSLFFPVRTES